MTAALDEAKSETMSKRSSMQDPVFDGKNKYLLLDAERASNSPTIEKGTAEADVGPSTGRPSPEKFEHEEFRQLALQ